MGNTALKMKLPSESYRSRTPLLVDELSDRCAEDRSWFWDFLSAIFQSPDLDYSQFEYMENKKTPQQMRKNGLY